VSTLFDVAKRNGWDLLQTTAEHIQATRDRPQPDLVVAPPDAPQHDDHELFAHGVLLVAEVVSLSSGHDDREFKRDACARGGVPLYLLIDPQAAERSVTLFSDPCPDGYRSANQGAVRGAGHAAGAVHDRPRHERPGARLAGVR
jgi:Uma2 family endonuclease